MTDEQPPTRRAAREAAGRPVRRQPRATASPDAAAGQTPGLATGDPQPVGGGLGALLRRHPAAWLIGALAVVFVLAGTGAVFAGVAYASGPPTSAPQPTPTIKPVRPLPTSQAAASRLRTCSVAALAADPRLLAFEGQVVRMDTGEVLFDRAASSPASTASVLKLFTAGAAVAVLGADYQISTRVVDGSTPGTIVLVGRGDATLSALPAGQESVYTGAPKLSDLASQTLHAYTLAHPGVPITSVVLDASYWNPSDKWDASWKRTEQTIGYHSEVTALQVDGDRQDPTRATSPRSTDPIGRAGDAFLRALRDADTGGIVDPSVATSTGAAVSGTAVLGEVKSQPLRTLIKQMLLPSDNTLAEMLARIVSKESSLGGSAASLQQAIPSALSGFGVSPAGLKIEDGSGLSALNAVPASTMTAFVTKISQGANGLDVVRDGLSLAGQTGSLASRFSGANAVARGHVAAKTGWIDTEYSLAGTINAADGTALAFTFYAIGPGIKDNAKAALDTLTTGVFSCGDNLSNN